MATTTSIEKVTPIVAEKWLNANKSNRKMRDGVAEKYADDMLNGRWTECTAPIVFYGDGDLADGQHRLWAVVMSKKTQVFDVKRGIDRAAGMNIDIGLGRSLVDNARISGQDSDLSNELIGVARAIEDGVHGGNAVGRIGARSNAAKLSLVALHRDASQWAISHGPRGRGLRNAIILGAIGRAWYCEEDKDRLARFGAVVSSGLYDGDRETAGIALRNYLFSKGPQTSSSTLWRDTFLKAMNAVHYFMRGKRLTIIKSVKEEAYPLTKKKAAPQRGAQC